MKLGTLWWSVFLACMGFAQSQAHAQNSNDIIRLFGGIMQSTIAQGALAEWRWLPETEIACIDRTLRTRGVSVQILVQRGVGPSDEQISEVRSACRIEPTQQAASPSKPVSGSTYSVDGLALGGRVAFESAVYREYQCAPSEQFEGFVRCQRTRIDREARGQFTSSYSILHSPDGTIAYVNRSLMPAFFEGREAQDEVDRLSNKHGAAPRIIPTPPRPGQPSGFIAVWGSVTLDPLDAANVGELAAGRSIRAGLLIDHIGSFQRSAQASLPIYRLGGGAGYVWSASWDERGRGSLRFLAIDPSAIAHNEGERIAAHAAEQNTAPAERERIDADRAARQNTALQGNTRPSIVQGDLSRLTQVPASCESAKQLGSRQLWVNDPLSRRRTPGPACQAILDCRVDLANQATQTAAFLRDKPEVIDALRTVAGRSSEGDSQVNGFLHDTMRGSANLTRLAPNAPCDYVWGVVEGSWIDLDARRTYPRPFELFLQTSRTLISEVRSEFNASEAEYCALVGFSDRYPGVERFELAYQAYADAVQADNIAAALRERKLFLREAEFARSRKQLLNEQSAELSRLTAFLSVAAAEYDRDGLARLSTRDIQAQLSALRAESERYAGLSPAQRGDVSTQLKEFAARRADLEDVIRAARSEKARLEKLDERRRAVLANIELAIAQSATDNASGKLPTEAEALLTGLRAKRDEFVRLGDIRLPDRPDYTADVVAAEAAARAAEAAAERRIAEAEAAKRAVQNNAGSSTRRAGDEVAQQRAADEPRAVRIAASNVAAKSPQSDGVHIWMFILVAYAFVAGLITLPLVRPPLIEWYSSSTWIIFGNGPIDILFRQIGFRLSFELFTFGISCVIGSLGGAIYVIGRRYGAVKGAAEGVVDH
jgi:hypothetical protein